MSFRVRVGAGTPEYMSPEMVGGGWYSGAAVDMWAAGVMLYLLVSARFPFLRSDEEYLDQVGPLPLPKPPTLSIWFCPPDTLTDVFVQPSTNYTWERTM